MAASIKTEITAQVGQDILKNGDTVICGHLELGYYDDEIWGEGSKV